MLISKVYETKNPPNWRMILRSGRDSNPRPPGKLDVDSNQEFASYKMVAKIS